MKPELKLVEDTGSQLEVDAFGPPPQQAEMPFAVVDGEPITQLPKDLYIPPDALQVFLEAFEGPLDLLLYLIRRQNLNVLDIPIAEITRQYMQYIDVMQELQLELAGEYLLMAAMLAEIKSRMLLPHLTSNGEEEDDPRAELVRRLQEYERFKKAAEDLDRLPRMERDTMAASAELIERQVVRVQPQVSLQEMLLAFKEVLSRADMFAHHHIRREQLSVRQRMSDILDRLREAAFIEFVRLFDPSEGRMGVTVTFIAVLELMKEGLLEIVQAEPYAPIHVRPASGKRHLSVVSGAEAGADADAENVAALAQPAYPDENDDPEEEAAPSDASAEVQPEAVAGQAAEGEQASLQEAAVVPESLVAPQPEITGSIVDASSEVAQAVGAVAVEATASQLDVLSTEELAPTATVVPSSEQTVPAAVSLEAGAALLIESEAETIQTPIESGAVTREQDVVDAIVAALPSDESAPDLDAAAAVTPLVVAEEAAPVAPAVGAGVDAEVQDALAESRVADGLYAGDFVTLADEAVTAAADEDAASSFELHDAAMFEPSHGTEIGLEIAPPSAVEGAHEPEFMQAVHDPVIEFVAHAVVEPEVPAPGAAHVERGFSVASQALTESPAVADLEVESAAMSSPEVPEPELGSAADFAVVDEGEDTSAAEDSVESATPEIPETMQTAWAAAVVPPADDGIPRDAVQHGMLAIESTGAEFAEVSTAAALEQSDGAPATVDRVQGTTESVADDIAALAQSDVSIAAAASGSELLSGAAAELPSATDVVDADLQPELAISEAPVSEAQVSEAVLAALELGSAAATEVSVAAEASTVESAHATPLIAESGGFAVDLAPMTSSEALAAGEASQAAAADGGSATAAETLELESAAIDTNDSLPAAMLELLEPTLELGLEGSWDEHAIGAATELEVAGVDADFGVEARVAAAQLTEAEDTAAGVIEADALLAGAAAELSSESDAANAELLSEPAVSETAVGTATLAALEPDSAAATEAAVTAEASTVESVHATPISEDSGSFAGDLTPMTWFEALAAGEASEPAAADGGSATAAETLERESPAIDSDSLPVAALELIGSTLESSSEGSWDEHTATASAAAELEVASAPLQAQTIDPAADLEQLDREPDAGVAAATEAPVFEPAFVNAELDEGIDAAGLAPAVLPTAMPTEASDAPSVEPDEQRFEAHAAVHLEPLEPPTAMARWRPGQDALGTGAESASVELELAADEAVAASPATPQFEHPGEFAAPLANAAIQDSGSTNLESEPLSATPVADASSEHTAFDTGEGADVIAFELDPAETREAPMALDGQPLEHPVAAGYEADATLELSATTVQVSAAQVADEPIAAAATIAVPEFAADQEVSPASVASEQFAVEVTGTGEHAAGADSASTPLLFEQQVSTSSLELRDRAPPVAAALSVTSDSAARSEQLRLGSVSALLDEYPPAPSAVGQRGGSVESVYEVDVAAFIPSLASFEHDPLRDDTE